MNGLSLSPHFTLADLIASETAVVLGIDNAPQSDEILQNLKLLAEKLLEPVVEKFGQIPVVTSAYRCPQLNAQVGGVANSQHVTGQAVDFQCPNGNLLEIARFMVQNLDFDQLLIERNKSGEVWLHASYVAERPNRKQVKHFDGQAWHQGLPESLDKMAFTDIQQLTWLPEKFRPYALLMRLDRPIGTWLLLLPAWWALLIAGAHPLYFIMFGIGAVVMRGAGCIINDLWDRDIDRKVERTRNRPLAAGTVTPKQALKFLAVLLLIGLAILLTLGWLAIGLGVFSLVLIVAYPLMKRITWWPQAFLGFTFNWGVLMGAAAVMDSLPPWAFTLYAGGVLWTLAYDTLYAHADVVDDALIGVKSTALRLGDQSRFFIGAFYLAAYVLLLISGLLAQMGWGFYAATLLVLLQVGVLMLRWKQEEPASCITAFRANRLTGFLVLLAIAAGLLSR